MILVFAGITRGVITGVLVAVLIGGGGRELVPKKNIRTVVSFRTDADPYCAQFKQMCAVFHEKYSSLINRERVLLRDNAKPHKLWKR